MNFKKSEVRSAESTISMSQRHINVICIICIFLTDNACRQNTVSNSLSNSIRLAFSLSTSFLPPTPPSNHSMYLHFDDLYTAAGSVPTSLDPLAPAASDLSVLEGLRELSARRNQSVCREGFVLGEVNVAEHIKK
jgi:hypothetical protein